MKDRTTFSFGKKALKKKLHPVKIDLLVTNGLNIVYGGKGGGGKASDCI